MEPNIFSPRINNLANKDTLTALLRNIALSVLVIVFGFLPIFFIPGIYTGLGITKTFFVISGLLLAIILLSLVVLRGGRARFYWPLSLLLFWGFALMGLASSALSGDVKDSITGLVFEVHTAGFALLMALVMTASLAFISAQKAIWRVFGLLGLSTLLLQFYHISRLIFGPDFLSFGIFNSATISPIGSFNDLAIFSGLVILVALVLIERLLSTSIGKVLTTILVVSSLLILAVVNFSAVWAVVGFFSLITLLYLVSRDTWLKSSEGGVTTVSRFALSLVAVVCLMSGAFVISGDYMGTMVSRLTAVNYLEVRPSLESTLNLTKAAWSEDALLGVGPNRFEDAWREYKNPVINQTIFWNTNFNGGSGYLFTIFATNGLAGLVFILLFLASFIYSGYKVTLKTINKESEWQVIGAVVVVAASYLWLMSIIYVPGVVIMLLLALATGLTLAVAASEKSESGIVLDVSENRQYGFLLIASVLVVIVASVLTVISVGKQYVASVIYADTVRAFQVNSDFVAADDGLRRAFELYPQDLFLNERAQLRLAELRNQTGQESATVAEQRNAALLSEGISLTEQAIALDISNPVNYLLLTNFYALLNPTEFEGVKERADAVFAEAKKYDPINPIYLLSQGQYKAAVGDLEASRQHLLDAVKLKNDYTDALFLLSQIDIQEGKVKDAISLTSAIISIEPGNPTRYFQLGVLLSTDNQIVEAIKSFETAVSIDPNYANARYFLALSYLSQDRVDDALIQLRLVEQTNPDNETVKQLIAQVEDGTYKATTNNNPVPVTDAEQVSTNEGVTTTTENPDTDLVKPVNEVLESSTGSNTESQ